MLTRCLLSVCTDGRPTPLLRSCLFWNLPFVFLLTCAYPLSAVCLHRWKTDPSFKKLFVLEPSICISFDLCLPFVCCLSAQKRRRPTPLLLRSCLFWNLPFVFLLTCAYPLSAVYTEGTLIETNPLLRNCLFWNLPFVFSRKRTPDQRALLEALIH